MGFCDSMSKIILIILNIIFFLIGAIVLSVGIWLKVDSSNLFRILGDIDVDASTIASTNTSVLDITAIVLIVIGVFTFVTGFCGCCGAMKESSCLLYSYCFLVGIVIIVQVGIGIYAGVYRSKLEDKIGKALKDIINKDFKSILNNNTTIFSKVYTGVMIDLKCCGVYDESDFNKSMYVNNQKHPVGCCQFKEKINFNPDKAVDIKYLNDSYVTSNCPYELDPKRYKVGCLKAMKSNISSNLAIVIGIAVGLALFEILCIVFACCVARRDEN